MGHGEGVSTVEIALTTPDLERLAAFYAGVLGADPVGRTPEDGPAVAVTFDLDGVALSLVAEDGAEPGAGRTVLTLGVRDVAAAVGRAVDLGGAVLAEPQDVSWGQRVASVQDPDGAALTLAQDL